MRKHNINELEFFNNVEIPQRIDKDNRLLERISFITIAICLIASAFMTFYLHELENYEVTRHYYNNQCNI